MAQFSRAFLDLMTSTTPGHKGLIEGTWLVRVPMSLVVAEMLTQFVSVEVRLPGEEE